ncbi:MAG TPA: ScyD/ScyE family protein [Thermomicrobiales bacterium]|nr:ScyD/ScyE family protein [Thermomicrobiales bacterium]
MTLKSASMDRRTFTMATGAAALAAGTVGTVSAQEASPAAGGESMGLPPLPEGATVVATGLYNPRYIAFADDGTMYITEVGTGGDEPFVFGPPAEESASPVAEPVVEEEATPSADAPPPSTRGYTGQITAIAPDGTQSVAVSGLASYSDGVGPQGIAVQDGLVYFTIGGSAVFAGVEPLIGENVLHSFDPATGTVTEIAEFNTYEIENNPDGTDVNPNIYAVSVGDSDGRLTVNDAGGNTVYSVDPATGEFQVRAVFPTLDQIVPDAGFDPRQVVPTAGVFKGTTYHTAFLSEFWPAEAPSVVSVAGDGAFATWTSVTTGRSFVTGLAVAPDGNLYLSQLFDDPEGAPVGTIFRILADGTVEPVVEGLVMPHGITFDGDGNLYVTIYILMSGPGMPAGQVVRFDGIGAAA